MSNMNALIAHVMQFVSGTMITVSQRDVTKIRSEQFSEFGTFKTTIDFILYCR